ncbi:DUF4890 domain-containing protein [Algoriphagus kandeliae]|uniref:DUF4890 domain-containing protein n=1 Tax=Algoriphagus kandeliae TaxID=2562278 RepID=A0A4Y9QXF3_9BACT|nr:DUF4890 domain-containing protein [Algoriphagus kandeliae]TFV95963.1 DUF4890 domain-containing protein [Algoriphagus kandeliae]
MKKILFSAGLVFLLSMGAFAQRGPQREMPDPETRAKMMTDRMAEQLGLSEEQKAKILAINLENAKKRQAEAEARKAEAEARREQAKAQEEEIKSILTEEQRQKWEELKEARRERGPRGNRGGEIHDREEFRKRRGGGQQ